MKETQKTFVIVTQPRSGSYFFQSLLNSAEDIICHGEIFKKQAVEISQWHSQQLGIAKDGVAQRDSMPLEFVMRLRKLNPQKIFGFKAFWPHLSPHKPLINTMIKHSEWQKIFLVRNPLQTYASLLRANKTNKWVKKQTSSELAVAQEAPPTVHFDPVAFEKHLMEYAYFLKKNHEIMARYPNSCLELGYSAALTKAKQDDVLQFLGSTSSTAYLKSEYARQYEGALNDAFENPDELSAYLWQKGLMEMLTTDRDIFDGCLPK